MAESTSNSPIICSEMPRHANTALPWVLLALWIVWLCALAWMARDEFTKARPKHQRERGAPPAAETTR